MTKVIKNNAVKIKVIEVDSYQKLVKEFRVEEIKFFAYQRKPIESPNLYYVIHIYHSIIPEEIKEAPQNEGSTIRNAINNIVRTVRYARCS